MSYSNKDLYDWDNQNITDWLNSKNLRNYTKNFSDNNITGYDLCFITQDDLKNELKIINFHERLNIMKEIRKLLLSQRNYSDI